MAVRLLDVRVDHGLDLVVRRRRVDELFDISIVVLDSLHLGLLPPEFGQLNLHVHILPVFLPVHSLQDGVPLVDL